MSVHSLSNPRLSGGEDVKKNGVDIYEGDLLDREGYGLFAITVDEFHGYRFMMGLDQLCKADAVYGQVIGNIYQNPEIDYRGKKL